MEGAHTVNSPPLPPELALRAALVKDGLLGVGQSFHAVVVMVVEEAAYPLIVRGGVEHAFPGEGIVLAQPLEAGLAPAGGAVLPPGQGDIVLSRLEHGPDGRGIAASGPLSVIDVQHQRPAVADNPDGGADDVVHLRGME